MYRSLARTGLARFFLALIGTILLGATALFGVGFFLDRAVGEAGTVGSRPVVPVTIAFVIGVSKDSGPFENVRISEQGAECETVLSHLEVLRRACVLATNEDADLIAGQARGLLNSEYTSAFEAIIWRGRLSAGKRFCSDAGLMGDWLVRCETSVGQAEYEVSESGVAIRVPMSSP